MAHHDCRTFQANTPDATMRPIQSAMSKPARALERTDNSASRFGSISAWNQRPLASPLDNAAAASTP